MNEQDVVEYTEKDSERKPNGLGHEVAQCIMGLSNEL